MGAGPIGTAIGSGIGGFLGSWADGNSLRDAAIDGAIDTAVGLIGGAAGKLLPSIKVIPVKHLEEGTETVGRGIIGRNMDRITPIGTELGSDMFTEPFTCMLPTLRKNFTWLMRHISRDDIIVDAGLDPIRKGYGPFYGMEKTVTQFFRQL